MNVSLENPRLTLWDLNRRECVMKYRGHKQQMHIVRPCFGGLNESLVLCGSEDACIYIWNKEKGDLLAKLEGAHTQLVNCVGWCPNDPFIFASASDDQTVRIWGLEEMEPAEVETKESKKIDQLLHSALHNGLSFGPGNSVFSLIRIDYEDHDDDDDEEGDDDEDNS